MTDVSDAEAREFYAELGLCFAGWTNIEVQLFQVLRVCTFETDFELLAGMFYAVENFRSKLAMVDSALKIELKEDHRWEAWTKKGGLQQRVISASKKRNNIAHWMALDLRQAKKPPSFYMRPNVFIPSAEPFEPTKPTGGYYVHDLRAIRAEFHKLADDLLFFWIEWRGPPEMLQVLKQQEQHQPTNPAQENPTSEGS